MRWLFALATLAGCRDESLVRLEALRDEMCACKTAACGDAVMKRIPPPQGGKKSSHRSQALARQMLDCLSELYRKDQPSLDPDREPAAE